MASRAQASAEFFIFIGLAFLIAVAFELASIKELNGISQQRENEIARDVGLKIQREMLIAASVEDGYSRNFELTEILGNINYTVSKQNSTITVESKKGYFIIPIPSAVGSISKGTNIINKTGGVIYIN